MARWHRARKLLRVRAGSRVLDLGCAFGYGTRLLATTYETYGHDLSPTYIERARRTDPMSTFTCGSADNVPYPDGYFDAVLLLDVLEHVPDTAAVIREVTRVLRAGGELVVSVPNRGALAALDSLNVYHALLGSSSPAPTDDPSWKVRPYHRHFSLYELRALFEPHFELRQVHFSGLGLAEPVNLALLLLCRAFLQMPRVFGVVQYLYFGAYLIEDVMPTGAYGYHLMVRMEKH